MCKKFYKKKTNQLLVSFHSYDNVHSKECIFGLYICIINVNKRRDSAVDGLKLFSNDLRFISDDPLSDFNRI